MYSNDLYGLLEDRGIQMTEQKRNLILGGETAFWSESVSCNFTIFT